MRERERKNKEEVTIKHCTLIEWLNPLTFPSGVAICCNLPFDGRARRKDKVCLLMKKSRRVATNVYSRKMLEKPKRGLQILKIRVWELFTQGKVLACHAPVTKDDSP